MELLVKTIHKSTGSSVSILLEELVTFVIKFLTNGALFDLMGEEGKRLVHIFHDWRIVCDAPNGAISDILEPRRRAAA